MLYVCIYIMVYRRIKLRGAVKKGNYATVKRSWSFGCKVSQSAQRQSWRLLDSVRLQG